MKKIYRNDKRDTYVIYEGKYFNVVIVFNDEKYNFIRDDNCYFATLRNNENFSYEEMKPEYKKNTIKEILFSKMFLDKIKFSDGEK